MASKYPIGNSGFEEIIAELSAAINSPYLTVIVEFTPNKFDREYEDVKIATAFTPDGKYVKIPRMARRRAYKTKLNRTDKSEDNCWTVYNYDNGKIRECYDATSFVDRTEMNGPYGKWFKYSIHD